MLSIEQILCARNFPRRKKGLEEEKAVKNQGGEELLKIMVVEQINWLSFVKTVAGRQIIM